MLSHFCILFLTLVKLQITVFRMLHSLFPSRCWWLIYMICNIQAPLSCSVATISLLTFSSKRCKCGVLRACHVSLAYVYISKCLHCRAMKTLETPTQVLKTKLSTIGASCTPDHLLGWPVLPVLVFFFVFVFVYVSPNCLSFCCYFWLQ